MAGLVNEEGSIKLTRVYFLILGGEIRHAGSFIARLKLLPNACDPQDACGSLASKLYARKPKTKAEPILRRQGAALTGDALNADTAHGHWRP
jgi:hypothetical protein